MKLRRISITTVTKKIPTSKISSFDWLSGINFYACNRNCLENAFIIGKIV